MSEKLHELLVLQKRLGYARWEKQDYLCQLFTIRSPYEDPPCGSRFVGITGYRNGGYWSIHPMFGYSIPCHLSAPLLELACAVRRVAEGKEHEWPLGQVMCGRLPSNFAIVAHTEEDAAMAAYREGLRWKPDIEVPGSWKKLRYARK